MNRAEPIEHVFDLSGGAPLPRLRQHPERPRPGAADRAPERLRRPGGLVASAGLVEKRRAAGLVQRAAAHPRQAARTLAAAVELREALFRLFSAVAAGLRLPPADLAALNRWLAKSLGRLRLAATGDGIEWGWADEPEALDAPLWRVARSAADLLTGEDRTDLRECADGGCRWLFLDRSRNHSRRWCDMKACGNRAKVRRHYRRQAAIKS